MKRLKFILMIALIALIFVPYSYAASLARGKDPAVKTITRTAMALPQTTQTSIFKVAGAPIEILSFTGVVTTVIQTQSCTIKIVVDPTTPATDTDIGEDLQITADAVGTYYSLVTSTATAIATYTNGAGPTMAGVFGIVVPIGNIDIAAGSSNTGNITWMMTYRGMPGSKVTAE